MTTAVTDVPRGTVQGFVRYFQHDFVSGLLVFLIALPLCLGISLASGFPPIAGIFTAIVGSILTTFISNSELTIKGPAAGLIVIVIGCVSDFGGDGSLGGFSDADMNAYKAALAVGFVAACLQIAFGVFRGGVLGEFFPLTPVHGMLAAIGVIIILKQFPVALGVPAKGDPLELLQHIPSFIVQANPAIALIGMISLFIMFTWPIISKRNRFLGFIPSPVIVLLIAIPLGITFDLLHKHSYVLQGHEYQLGEQYLVTMPSRVFGMFDEITTPDFAALSQFKAWKWVFMFFMIGTLESMLSAKAVDLIDPWRRKTSMNRDVLAVGVGNLASAMVGGLPMISEIVRSRANIDNGARTRFADLWHGIFLLACVALIPMVLHWIPLAALAAMLVYTGFRLAHPKEFINVYRIGREQLLIFVITLVSVLATDLLIGIAIGIGVKIAIHLMNGVPIKSLFKPYLEIEQLPNETCLIRAHQSAVFSNWIPFRRQIEDVGFIQRQNIIVDLSDTQVVDHSVMEKLHELQGDFTQTGLRLDIVGLDAHEPIGQHDLAARRGKLARMKKIGVIADESLIESLENAFADLGAMMFTSTPCRVALRNSSLNGQSAPEGTMIRLEAVAPIPVCDRIVGYLRQEILSRHRVIVTLESVEVIRRDFFDAEATLQRIQNSASIPHGNEAGVTHRS